MKEPLVSVLIPLYNAEKWLEETVQSVLNQTWPNIEIIIVDDGSTDNSLKLAESITDDRIKICSQPNSGASTARNKAFAESKGEYIQYLDADDLLAPDKIKNQMTRLEKEPDRALASGPFFEFIENIEETLNNPDLGYKDYNQPLDWLIDAAWGKAMFPPLVWLTPRRLIEEAGPWNEQLSYNDDPEFFARVLLKADKIAFCKEAKSYYRRGIPSSLGSRSDAKAIHSRFNALKLVSIQMLHHENSLRVKEACAFEYRKFIYSVYPNYKGLRYETEIELEKLGVKGSYDFSNKKSRQISRCIGWKAAKRMKYYYDKILNG